MVRFSSLLCAAGAAVLFSAGPASAAFTFDDIDFWVGSGANQAALVIDFNDGVTPASLAWGYRWDGDKSNIDLFTDIVAADERLFAKIGTLGSFGLPLYGIGYDLDDDGVFGVDDSTVFDSDGFAVVGSGDADGASATDSQDHYEEGWFSDGFWVHFVDTDAPFNGGSWDSGSGLGSATLVNGSWQGFSFDPAFSFTDPPSEPVAAALPEPGTLALLAVGVTTLVVRRR